MSIGLVMPPGAQRKILGSACDRNQSAEFSLHAEGGPPERTKVRLLELRGETLWIDQPFHHGRPMLLRPGSAVSIVFTWGEQRLGFTSSVIERTTWTSSRGQKVPALALQAPATLEKAQRRGCYRLSLVHLPDAIIRFMKADGSGEPFDALLVNISETGCGISSEKDMADHVKVGDLYIGSFTLPDDPAPIVLVGEVRWCRPLRNTDRIEMGIQWQLDEGDPEARRVQRRLAIFIAQEQRLALQRQRDARD